MTRLLPDEPHSDVARAAWLYSTAGLIPFLWFSVQTMAKSEAFGVAPMHALLAYAAVILSFVSGIIWMRALSLTGHSRLSVWLMGISVIPALVGWAALLVGGDQGLLYAIAGFVGLLAVEYQLFRAEMMARWFWRLRLFVTGLVILSLTLSYLTVRVSDTAVSTRTLQQF